MSTIECAILSLVVGPQLTILSNWIKNSWKLIRKSWHYVTIGSTVALQCPLKVKPLTTMDYISVEKVFYPFYLHSRFFGCNLFHLPKSSKTLTVSINRKDVLLLIAYVTIYVSMFVSLNYSDTESDRAVRNILFHLTKNKGSLIMEFLGRTLFHIFAFTNVSMNIMDLINRNKIWKILCEIHSFDDKVVISTIWKSCTVPYQ